MTENVVGLVSSIVFHSPKTGFTVLRLETDAGLVNIVGTFPELEKNERLEVYGNYTTHPTYGRQLKAEGFSTVRPHTSDEIEKYLASGNISGIGPATAAEIVRRFGSETLDVMDKDIERLLDVPGIGQKKMSVIRTEWAAKNSGRDTLIGLIGAGVSPTKANKIIEKYGELALDQVRTNPYELTETIRGFGFKTADGVARKFNVPADSPFRIRSGILYALEEALSEGHVFLPKKVLVERTTELLELDASRVGDVLSQMLKSSGDGGRSPVILDLVDGGLEAVYLRSYYFFETETASLLCELNYRGESRLGEHSLIPPTAFIDYERLSPLQATAVEAAVTNRISVLTGGPGTGKSYTLKALIEVLEQMDKKYALAAPTGRAAKRMTEATDRPASTIHRLLSYSPDQDDEDIQEENSEEEVLNLDFLIVDETSMLDLPLANRLLRHVPTGAHILFVGDVNQLPSVGAGQFLDEVISTGLFKVTKLTEIFRQGEASDIVLNAHKINRGEIPNANVNQKDFYLFNCEGGTKAVDWAVDLVKNRIPRNFKVPSSEVQVLSPMHGGNCGVKAINIALQEALNPPAPGKNEKRFSPEKMLRDGDRVLVIRNDYTKNVFNGDIGMIVSIDDFQQTVVVSIDNRDVTFSFDEVDKLVLAYCCTIHKSQGSEFPIVVVVLEPEHYKMLARNLFYTAITRAKKYCVMVSNQRAMGTAVNNNQVSHRYTALTYRVREIYLKNFFQTSPVAEEA